MAPTSAAPSDLTGDTERILAGAPQTMGIPLAILAWYGPVCHALRNVLSTPPAEAHLFRRVLAHAARFGKELAADATDRLVSQARRTEEYPVASFLLSVPTRPSPLERNLAWIILEAHLSRGHDDLVITLAQIFRGLTGKGTSRLKDTIAKCGSPSRLLAKMERLGGLKPELGITGHQTFDSLWRESLQAFCVSMVQQAELALTSPPETPESRLDLPNATTESPTDLTGDDPDEGMCFPSLPVGLEQKIRPTALRHALDWSSYMSRRSSPDILMLRENAYPADLRKQEWLRTAAEVGASLDRGDIHDAEYQLAAMLSIEAGLSAREAVNLSFGSTTDGRIPVVDLTSHALRRPELLPPNYFIPKPADNRWLPVGGDAIFPLSSQCVLLAKRLLEARASRREMQACHLLLSGQIETKRLRAATKGQDRLVLAIGIADAMGPDAAQRAFGDTFGLSSAPVFYGSYHAQELAKAIASVNDFAGHDVSDRPWISACDHWLGSRARPKDPPYRGVWAQLQGSSKRSRGRPSEKNVLGDWRKRRDRLVIHFILATGHRPSKSLAKTTLHDFLPQHALAVVSDKSSDPSHLTRLVCTGWRFTGELESFVRELSRLVRNPAPEIAKDLAARILAGEAPLFSIPTTDSDEEVDIRGLIGELDPLWSFRPNLHRHGLCQFLIGNHVDPELRYFQMGWLSHEHHATSDSAPFPPAQLGQELAATVDEWLDQCGWLGGGPAEALDKIIPTAKLLDWKSKRKEHLQASRSAVSALKSDLHEKGRTLEKIVWERIRAESASILPNFDASESGTRLFTPIPTSADQPRITQLQVEALLSPFNDSARAAVERFVASKVLRRALLKTAKTHEVRVYLPEVTVLSRHQHPSPFLNGLGLAVAQTEALKAALVHYLANGKPSTAKELAAIATWMVVLDTPFRDLDQAVRLLKGTGRSEHSMSEPWLLRVPDRAGHIALTGDPAALVRRLVACEDWEDALDGQVTSHFSYLGSLVRTLLPRMCGKIASHSEVALWMAETARVAGVVTLNGAERLILTKAVEPVSVLAKRAVMFADDQTGTGDEPCKDASSSPRVAFPSGAAATARVPLRDIEATLRAFDPDFRGEIMGAAAEPVSTRRRQLTLALESTLSKLEAKPTASRLLLEYAWHLLREGGPRSSGGQAISTINKTIHRLTPVLRNLGAGEGLDTLIAEELTALCDVACQAAKRRSSRDVLGELRRFFKHFSTRYPIADPEWDFLYRSYGAPIRGGDPALLGDAEVSRVIEVLHQNTKLHDAPDADPVEKRYREVCLVAALLSEASGARPRSIYGLTFADILLGENCAFIHLKPRGRFASIKTRTSAGYIPLEGKIWRENAAWFKDWFSDACSTQPAESLDSFPLFQVPGEAIGVRFELRKVFEPIGSLIRWSTQQSRGRTYWLRKRRVRARHLAVQSKPGARARDMARAMKLDGHALMSTPLAKYLSEPVAYSTLNFGTQAISTRAGAIAVTGYSPKIVDRAFYGSDIDERQKFAKLLKLSRTNHEVTGLPPPPKLPRLRSDLAWASVERMLRDLAEGGDVEWVASRHSAQKQQVDSIVRAQQALTARLKTQLGVGSGQLSPPRHTAHSLGWLRLLEKEDARLVEIANDWVAVASTASLDSGCSLFESSVIDSLLALSRELGLHATCGDPDQATGVSLVRFGDSSGATYGAWRALRWTLSVAWICQHRLRLLGSV